jgi:hypothetical protein
VSILTLLTDIKSRMPGDHARWYRFVVRGEIGSLLAGSLREIEVTSFRGWTSITARVRDVSEFYGLLDRLALLPTVGTARVTVAASAIRAALDRL